MLKGLGQNPVNFLPVLDACLALQEQSFVLTITVCQYMQHSMIFVNENK